MFSFTIHHRHKAHRARTGEFKTPHGTLQTPNLAIVGTEGQVKSLTPEVTKQLPIPYSIVNTFHTWTKNIIPSIQKAGTVHQYGGFPGVVASDSGGFQVFSLGFGSAHNVGKHATTTSGSSADFDTSNPLTITEEGVTFSWNNEEVTLTPEKSMELQHHIGADIMFAFDECTSPYNSQEYTARSIELTDRWLTRCVAKHAQLTKEASAGKLPQALFAIVQGGEWQDLRIRSAQYCAKADVPGFGIGGSFGGSYGDSKQNMHRVLEWVIPELPDEKPRHLLGIGQVDDLFECVERGVDLFDCVIPTREARHRVAYTKIGKYVVKKNTAVDEPLDAGCACQGCREKLTKAQLYELFLQKDPRAYFYTTVHNIQFFADLMEEIRRSIAKKTFDEVKSRYLAAYL